MFSPNDQSSKSELWLKLYEEEKKRLEEELKLVLDTTKENSIFSTSTTSNLPPTSSDLTSSISLNHSSPSSSLHNSSLLPLTPPNVKTNPSSIEKVFSPSTLSIEIPTDYEKSSSSPDFSPSTSAVGSSPLRNPEIFSSSNSLPPPPQIQTPLSILHKDSLLSSEDWTATTSNSRSLLRESHEKKSLNNLNSIKLKNKKMFFDLLLKMKSQVRSDHETVLKAQIDSIISSNEAELKKKNEEIKKNYFNSATNQIISEFLIKLNQNLFKNRENSSFFITDSPIFSSTTSFSSNFSYGTTSNPIKSTTTSTSTPTDPELDTNYILKEEDVKLINQNVRRTCSKAKEIISNYLKYKKNKTNQLLINEVSTLNNSSQVTTDPAPTSDSSPSSASISSISLQEALNNLILESKNEEKNFWIEFYQKHSSYMSEESLQILQKINKLYVENVKTSAKISVLRQLKSSKTEE